MAASSSSSSASGVVRSWRTAFLTLRDEALTAPPPAALSCILRAVVLSHPPGALASAASEMPPHEVVSDVVFLAELGSAVSVCEGAEDMLLQVFDLIHNVSFKVRMELNSSSWTVMLNFLQKIVDWFPGKTESKRDFSSSLAGVKCMMEIIDILRNIVKGCGKNCSSIESNTLVKLLLRIVLCSYADLFSHSNYIHWENNGGIKNVTCKSVWELHTIAFSMIGDAFLRDGSFVSVDSWQSALEVLRKVMDFLASKNFLLEGYEMSRFYVALLDCLHVVLSSPKVSLSEHVAGLVVTLQMFLTYGLNHKVPMIPGIAVFKQKEFTSSSLKSGSVEPRKTEHSRYIPPHLRKKGVEISHPSTTPTSDHEPFKHELTSSDSEHSDSDRSVKDGDIFRSSKARIAALICIQDLCRVDPKSLTSIWTMLLPTSDVLQPRKHRGTLMACLLFDPALKTRMASASALATVLESHSSVFLQVAEYKESSKCESFTTLSSSLGQTLLQMHRGILHLIQHETHGGFLASLFKVLILLISATPYSRMPGELLPTVIASIWKRIIEGPTIRTDQTSLMGTAFACLAAAMSTSPPSQHVSAILEEDASAGLLLTEQKSNVVSVILQFSQREVHPTIRFEALQALRALLHNYPNVAPICWERLSSNVLRLLQSSLPEESGREVPENLLMGPGNTVASANERCTASAIKVLDEGLRAASGFQGTDNLLECRLLDIQLLSGSIRKKKVSSAPSCELNMLGVSKGNPAGHPSGATQWNEVIDKHLPLTLSHGSPLIRAAGITCLAGMTSSVFFSLDDYKRKFIINSVVCSALNDKVPSVRAAACRAIGVVTCFPQIFSSSKLQDDIVHAIEYNTHDPQISVRITSSWALANICDSLRHRATDLHSDHSSGQVADSEFISFLFECALRLAKDGDKIKSNAVRALGNLSRFVGCSDNSTADSGSVESTSPGIAFQWAQSLEIHHCSEASDPEIPPKAIKSVSLHTPHWLERMVQAFVSCVTTGNVKVQWNVCHALGNLFLNETLKLRDASWAPSVYSILLLLVRDSTNFKIRIHASVALSVPASRVDYGSSFCDIVQGLEHVLESIASERVSNPSSFKYRDAFEKQLTLTMLHVLGLASSEDEQALKDFLIKKASFLEQWLSSLCSLFPQLPDQPEHETSFADKQNEESTSHELKKQMILKATKSLLDICKCSNQNSIYQRFEKLARLIMNL
uniref:HEAT repeat-containing protein 6 n=1 Tax=Anthurium amnicola TaxID=1678845 RepID=A0A1D1Y3V8_9ARAE